MQQPFLWIDHGAGPELLNDHWRDLAALAGFSIRWGTDSPASQPDPAVMTFTLRDTTGHFAGRAATLAGARVLLQVSQQPRYTDMPERTYASYPATRTVDLHASYTPPVPSNPASPAITLFDGILSNGGSVEHTAKGWLLALSATSRMVLWKRLQSAGPASGEARYAGHHWVGTPAQRVAELKRRAQAAGAPTVIADDLDQPLSVTSYTTDYPSMLDLLHRMYATASQMPLWCEYPRKAESYIGYCPLAEPVPIGLDADGRLWVESQNYKDDIPVRTSVSGRDLAADTGYDVPEPYTQIVIRTKAVKSSDGVLEYADADTTMGDQGRLPANLKATQKSLTLESDVPATDASGGLWDGGVWNPSATARAQAAAWLHAINMRLRPSSVTFDSLRTDPARRPYLYQSAPSGPIVLTDSLAGRLTGSDGRPAFSGAWTTIGGTLTFTWKDGRPRLRHEVTLWPLPQVEGANTLTWNDMAGYPATYLMLHTLTVSELGSVSEISKTPKS